MESSVTQPGTRAGTYTIQYNTIQYNTIQYNVIDLRRRNSLLVWLRDRDASWKDGCLTCLKGSVEQMAF